MQSTIAALLTFCLLYAPVSSAQVKPLKMSAAEYEDRVRGAWIGQIIGTLMGFQFEGKVAESRRVNVDQYPKPLEAVPVDDDYYYELIALRAFEKYGVGMTLDQLGQIWKEHSAGTWGSSEQTRFALAKGVPGSQAGHPRYNRLWWTIGAQFSADIYGMIAPGDINLAGRLARQYGHINGYAEGADAAVFVAGMVSLAFRETDVHQIVRESAKLIHPSSPYRQCLDMVISLAERGKTAQEVFDAIEDRWRIEYPPLNNGVANGGLVAASVWFSGGDFLKGLNLAFQAADFSDADCNAANVGAVIGAMHGTKALPPHLVAGLHDRIAGNNMGPLAITPPVDERISDVVSRIAVVGRKMIAANGSTAGESGISVPYKPVATQPAELFAIGELMNYWQPEWTLDRAGFGGIRWGACLRTTYVNGDVLATWPRDEVRGTVLRRNIKLGASPSLDVEVAAEQTCAWRFDVFVNNVNVFGQVIEGSGPPEQLQWQKVSVDLARFAGQDVEIRLYQRTILKDRIGGNAFWRNLALRP